MRMFFKFQSRGQQIFFSKMTHSTKEDQENERNEGKDSAVPPI